MFGASLGHFAPSALSKPDEMNSRIHTCVAFRPNLGAYPLARNPDSKLQDWDATAGTFLGVRHTCGLLLPDFRDMFLFFTRLPLSSANPEGSYRRSHTCCTWASTQLSL